jgi:hypothetical protein
MPAMPACDACMRVNVRYGETHECDVLPVGHVYGRGRSVTHDERDVGEVDHNVTEWL